MGVVASTAVPPKTTISKKQLQAYMSAPACRKPREKHPVITSKREVIERACRQLYRTHRKVYLRIAPDLFEAFRAGQRFLVGGTKVIKVLRVHRSDVVPYDSIFFGFDFDKVMPPEEPLPAPSAAYVTQMAKLDAHWEAEFARRAAEKLERKRQRALASRQRKAKKTTVKKGELAPKVEA